MTTLTVQHKISGFQMIRKTLAVIDALDGCLQRYHQRRQLAELDERMLRDIGLDSAQVRTEISKPFWK